MNLIRSSNNIEKYDNQLGDGISDVFTASNVIEDWLTNNIPEELRECE
jgi:hypothetical protein